MAVPIPRALGKKQSSLSGAMGASALTEVQGVSQGETEAATESIPASTYSPRTVAEPSRGPLPHRLWAWPRDSLWPMGRQQA